MDATNLHCWARRDGFPCELGLDHEGELHRDARGAAWIMPRDPDDGDDYGLMEWLESYARKRLENAS